MRVIRTQDDAIISLKKDNENLHKICINYSHSVTCHLLGTSVQLSKEMDTTLSDNTVNASTNNNDCESLPDGLQNNPLGISSAQTTNEDESDENAMSGNYHDSLPDLQFVDTVESTQKEKIELTYSSAAKSLQSRVNETRQIAKKNKPSESGKVIGRVSQHANESVGICKEQENAESPENNGFVGVKRTRVNTKRFFLSEIAENATTEMIPGYLSKKEIYPTLLRIFPSRRKGTISGKLNVRIGDIKTILEENFWPKFVICKPWLSKEK